MSNLKKSPHIEADFQLLKKMKLKKTTRLLNENMNSSTSDCIELIVTGTKEEEES